MYAWKIRIQYLSFNILAKTIFQLNNKYGKIASKGKLEIWKKTSLSKVQTNNYKLGKKQYIIMVEKKIIVKNYNKKIILDWYAYEIKYNTFFLQIM